MEPLSSVWRIVEMPLRSNHDRRFHGSRIFGMGDGN